MIGVSLVVIALVAQAAEPAMAQSDKVVAQRLLSEGAALYDRGDIAQALLKFREAYAAYPSPKLLFNIGQASRDLGKYDESLVSFERFLAEAPDAPRDMTAEAQDSVVKLKSRLGMVNIVCTTAGVEVRVDGKSIPFEPPSHLLWAIPGNHQVTARYPGAAPAVTDVDAALGTVRAVVFQLKVHAADAEGRTATVVVAGPPQATGSLPASRSTATPSAAQVMVALPAAQVAPESKGWWLGRTWTWVAAGGAVALAGGAVATGLATQSKSDSLYKSCGKGSPEHLGCSQGDIDSVVARRNATNVLWGLAGAAAVTAGFLFYVEDRPVRMAPVMGTATGLLVETVF